MPGPIQKIWIAKRNVPRARSYEPANVFKNNLLRHYEKASIVHWWDRAMRTEMQTPAARFDITHQPLLAVVLELRVMLKRHKCVSVGRGKVEPSKRRLRCEASSAYVV